MSNQEEGIIKNHFGSKLGCLRSLKHQFLNMAGKYDFCKDLHFSKVKRLIFVCSGNICRSPLAEAVARQAAIPSESYGLHCRGGDRADPRALKLAQEWGMSLNNHITRNISEYRSQPGDLLVGMEPCHLNELKLRVGRTDTKMTLAGLWLELPQPYLHDPYNTNDYFFRKCEEKVIKSSKLLIASVSLENAKT